MLEALYADEDGLSTIDYALLMTLLLLAAIIAWTALTADGSSLEQSSRSSTDPATNAR